MLKIQEKYFVLVHKCQEDKKFLKILSDFYTKLDEIIKLMCIKLMIITVFNYDSRLKENRKRAFDAASITASILNINNLN